MTAARCLPDLGERDRGIVAFRFEAVKKSNVPHRSSRFPAENHGLGRVKGQERPNLGMPFDFSTASPRKSHAFAER